MNALPAEQEGRAYRAERAMGMWTMRLRRTVHMPTVFDY